MLVAACVPIPPGSANDAEDGTAADLESSGTSSTSSVQGTNTSSSTGLDGDTTGGATAHSDGSTGPRTTGSDAETTSGPATQCGYLSPIDAGVVTAPVISEASGMVHSRKHAVLCNNHDSGDTPRLHVVQEDGTFVGSLNVPGAWADDWEDIAIGPGPTPGVDYLYVADIGDNDSNRPYVTIYRFPEPSPDELESDPLASEDVVAIHVQYPNGPRNAETLLADPLTGGLYIISKVSSVPSTVYSVPVPHRPEATATAQIVTNLELGTERLPGDDAAVGGDISADGSWIFVRTSTHAFVWPRSESTFLDETFASSPCAVELAFEAQGETLAASHDGQVFFTLSEGIGSTLYRYATR